MLTGVPVSVLAETVLAETGWLTGAPAADVPGAELEGGVEAGADAERCPEPHPVSAITNSVAPAIANRASIETPTSRYQPPMRWFLPPWVRHSITSPPTGRLPPREIE